jgi:predicted ATPase
MNNGKLTIFIGPNGSGKTHELIELKKKEKNSFMVPSEIIFQEETKDTKDSTLVMEQLIGELIMPNVDSERKNLENRIDQVIMDNQAIYNDKLKNILNINGTEFEKDFISITAKKEYKKIVSINNDFLKKSVGSGQASLFILSLLTLSNKENIFVDEPEKFCHQAMLFQVAGIIHELIESGKNVFIVTHSPELVKLLNWDFENLFIFNELSIDEGVIKEVTKKQINVSEVYKVLFENDFHTLLKTQNKSDLKIIGSYFESSDNLERYLKIRRNDFVDMLFTNNIYLVEGINDTMFIKFKEKEYRERSIFPTFSKFLMPMYLILLNQVKNPNKTKISVVFDSDGNNGELHKKINNFIINNSDQYIMFNNNIEDEFGIAKDDKNDSVLIFKKFEDSSSKIDSIEWIEGVNKN